MFYFIPSWYNHSRPWYDDTPVWFRVFERMHFDDTIHQIRMFSSSNEPAKLVLLNYQPQLRYLLHKQSLLQSSYWSVFDDIQNIKGKTTKAIDFKKLNWPEGTHFIYTPFAIVAKYGGENIANIYFAENGNLFYIDYLRNDQTAMSYIFDDRGFLSSILCFDEKGQPWYQDYLNENGICQVREYLSAEVSGLTVSPDADQKFLKRHYASWEELIKERLLVFRAMVVHKDDVLVIAANEQHNQLLLSIFVNNKKVFSFFGNRYSLQDLDKLQSIVSASQFLVTESEKNEQELSQSLRQLGMSTKSISRISPFDTRLRLGHSQYVKELLTYFYIDDISREELEAVLKEMIDVMDHLDDMTLKVVTFNNYYPLAELKEWVGAYIRKFYDVEKFFAPPNPEEINIENQLDEDELLDLSRITFACFSNENQIIEVLDIARLVVDLGPEPDLYTQIASISAGVPQINAVKTDYVSHKENGWVLENTADLKTALHYYYDGLAHWNEALVHAVQRMSDYTSGRLLAQWKELLEN